MSTDSLFSTLSEIENLSESDTKEMVESIIAIFERAQYYLQPSL